MYRNTIISVILLSCLFYYLYQNSYKRVYGIAHYYRDFLGENEFKYPKQEYMIMLLSQDRKYLSANMDFDGTLKYGERYYSNWISVDYFESKIDTNNKWGPWRLSKTIRFND